MKSIFQKCLSCARMFAFFALTAPREPQIWSQRFFLVQLQSNFKAKNSKLQTVFTPIPAFRWPTRSHIFLLTVVIVGSRRNLCFLAETTRNRERVCPDRNFWTVLACVKGHFINRLSTFQRVKKNKNPCLHSLCAIKCKLFGKTKSA